MKNFLIVLAGLFSVAALAQAVTDPIAPADFLTQVIASVKAMGGMPVLLKISSVIVLIIATMKVTVLNDVIWSKIGKLQIWVAPVLGLVASLLAAAAGGQLSLASAFAYMTAGAGAVFIHEILDLVKSIPGIGSIYVSIINVAESVLGGPASKQPK